MNLLASPAQGHTPLRAVLEPSLSAEPQALLVNRVTTKKGHLAKKVRQSIHWLGQLPRP